MELFRLAPRRLSRNAGAQGACLPEKEATPADILSSPMAPREFMDDTDDRGADCPPRLLCLVG